MVENNTADENARKARVRELRLAITKQLDAIAKLYVDDVKITLIVRVPDYPNGARDTVMTDDDPEKAIAALRSLYADPTSEQHTS